MFTHFFTSGSKGRKEQFCAHLRDTFHSQRLLERGGQLRSRRQGRSRCRLSSHLRCKLCPCMSRTSVGGSGGRLVCVRRVLLVLRWGCHSITESRPSAAAAAAVMCSWAAPLCRLLHSDSPAIEELRPDPDAAFRAMKTLAGGDASCHLNYLHRPHVTA